MRGHEEMAPLPKNVTIDYGNVHIQKLPDGAAFGADDLAKWGHRRALGRSGTGPDNSGPGKVTCRACGAVSQVIEAKRADGSRFRRAYECRACGQMKAFFKVKKKKGNKNASRR
jgi:hypothetical protein